MGSPTDAGLATASDGAETGNGLAVTSLVLVRQNARHLFEPRTPETEVTSSAESALVGSSLTELIVVQDECAGCLPLAAMLRPHRTENQLSAGPEAGASRTPIVLLTGLHYIAAASDIHRQVPTYMADIWRDWLTNQNTNCCFVVIGLVGKQSHSPLLYS